MSVSRRPVLIALTTTLTACLALLASGCTTKWSETATGSTHSGNCKIVVEVARQDSTTYGVQTQTTKSAGSSGVTCSIGGSVRFSDGTTFTVPKQSSYGRMVKVKRDAVLTSASFRWTTSYYGTVQDEGRLGYG